MADDDLNHTVFLVGWDKFERRNKKTNEMETMPVWVVRNSYGNKWGSDGDFYVRRGQNDFGIEDELSGY